MDLYATAKSVISFVVKHNLQLLRMEETKFLLSQYNVYQSLKLDISFMEYLEYFKMNELKRFSQLFMCDSMHPFYENREAYYEFRFTEISTF